PARPPRSPSSSRTPRTAGRCAGWTRSRRPSAPSSNTASRIIRTSATSRRSPESWRCRKVPSQAADALVHELTRLEHGLMEAVQRHDLETLENLVAPEFKL